MKVVFQNEFFLKGGEVAVVVVVVPHIASLEEETESMADAGMSRSADMEMGKTM